LTIALAVSVGVHLLLLPWIAKDAVFHVPVGVRRTPVGLIATPRGQVQHAQRGLPSNTPSAGKSEPDLQPQLPPALQEQPKPPKIDGQVVSLGSPKDERPPDKPTKYLSEHDSRVLKETRARETSPFFKNPLSKPQNEGKEQAAAPKVEAAAPNPAPTPGDNGGGQAQKNQAVAKNTLPKRERTDPLHLERSPDGTVKNRDSDDAVPGSGRLLAMAQPGATSNQPQPGGEGIPGLRPGAPGKRGPLTLTLDRPGDALGPVAGGPMNDYLRDVEEGDETLLNSRSFRYAGFLNRVKETVARIWVREVQDESQRRDPTGHIYSYKDRRTVVEFSLDRAGEIKDVHLAVSCGVDYLDKTAIDAFKRAERFPNPPPGLVGEDGLVRLPFAFTLLAATGGVKLQIGPAYLPNSPAQRGF
jgi:TonB family protein